MAKMEFVKTVPEMPMVGLGLWKAGPGEVTNVVYEAIKAGYRHLDGAAAYGNEKEVGAGIKKALDEGICKREELFVVSKLWNNYHKKEHVPLAMQKTLDDLGLDYLDLYLVHFPVALNFVPIEQEYPPPDWNKCTLEFVSFRETWEAMEALKESGKAKHIGVSNITCQMMMDIFSYAKQKPEVNQVELHLYLQQPELVAFCQANGVAVTSYSTFGAIGYVGIGFATADQDCLKDPVVLEVSKAHGKSPAQICLRYMVQQGISVIPKSTRVERLNENKDVFSFELTADEMSKLAALDKNLRFNNPIKFAPNWHTKASVPIFN